MPLPMSTLAIEEVEDKGRAAKAAARTLAIAGTNAKNAALTAMADALETASRRPSLEANGTRRCRGRGARD